MRPAQDAASLPQASARLYRLSSERRSSDMTTGAIDKGAAGRPVSSATSGGSGHSSSHISSAIPAVLVVLVIILGSLLGWYIARRMRLSGRRILSFLMGSEQKPELSEIVLTETTLRHTSWSTLSPIAIDFVSPEERDLWVSKSSRSSSSPPKHMAPRTPAMRSHHASGSCTRKAERLDSEPGSLRVAVFIAMPAQRGLPGDEPPYADRKIRGVQSTELCIGIVQASIV
ncbi:hypothetical protein L227DRAFT_336764 [Lentinus tigrinus ALCF2SS1-6]|uniref:Uncharacterized protein n=1 Tax=Lentinus tigrinus ALCF2SS1-6 TaxID=1328759 RepID=A0A5C2RTH5_9APHY|nr:hypothetical protein L227DRAFT_336764 [Lentinus tigrinus ALCF2SS1-6]